MKKHKKKAILVLGSESSGTRLWTRILIEAGCFGDGGHVQRWDSLPPNKERLIVWRKSVPHAEKLPEIEIMVDYLRNTGYEVVAYVTTRDWVSMMNSQVGKHTDSIAESFGNLQIAYPFIFRYIKDLEIPFAMVSYEAIVHQGKEYINGMLEIYDLKPVELREEIKDANAKYYEKCYNK